VRFRETQLSGAFVLESERHVDERGFFARTFCARELEAHGIRFAVAQSNLSFNRRAGTIRGMHLQAPPVAESKLVRCGRGAMYDVIVDLRPASATYLQHVALELSDVNGRSLYVPAGFAHGFQTLTDNVEVEYLMGDFHVPGCDRGLRYDDPALGIRWPLPVSVISEKDLAWPLLVTVSDADVGVCQ
jgi:dTDP-4-dehydrorhamnose 3,5-epimerase